jgi:hypothetical protein
MVTAKLIGGLGNNLFQIATTYSLCLDNNVNMLYDIHNVTTVHKNIKTYTNNILRNIKFIETHIPTKKTHNELNFHYDKIEYTESLKLSGYFQSEKYFKHNREKILDLFSIDDHSLKYINEKYGDLFKYKTCSLHVRRGDYLNYPGIHPICTLDYYQKALEKIGTNSLYLIFSDDINWCKQVFKGSGLIFIENEMDFIELWMMSLCNNNIIANSSFSWWGAWLNKNENKTVIAPETWFGPTVTHNTKDLYCDNWIII